MPRKQWSPAAHAPQNCCDPAGVHASRRRPGSALWTVRLARGARPDFIFMTLLGKSSQWQQYTGPLSGPVHQALSNSCWRMRGGSGRAWSGCRRTPAAAGL